MKYCGHCGAKLKDDAKFCANCGNKCSDVDNTARRVQSALNRRWSPHQHLLYAAECIVILVVLIGVIIPQHRSSEVPNYCWDQVSNYSVISEESPNNVTVSIVAPDYAQLILGVILEDGEAKINPKALSDAINNNPNQQKEYIVTSNGSDEESIKQALMEQIAKELMIESIIQSNYTEDWGGK